MTNIAAHAEAVAKAYWGEPAVRRGHILRWGTHGSKELDLRKGTWFDFENNEGGGVVDLVRRYEGATILGSIPDILEKKFGIQKQTQVSLQPARFMSACYDYVDENGEVRYQVRRFEPKTFRQCRPDGKGGWLYNMQDVEALPYRLPDILARPDEPVFIVEGEKAADKVATMGLLATSSHGGAKKWQSVLNRWFEGRNVVILPDNDEPGHAHADLVAAELYGVAARIKRVELPSLPDKGDIVDWLAAGNGKDELLAAVKAAPALEQAPDVQADDYNNDNNEGDFFEFVGASYIRNMPPIDWVVGEGDKGIITQHGLSVMYGAPGAGKSFIALDMALCIAEGLPWQGIPTRQGKVLYIAGEGVGGLGKRLKAWEAHNDVRVGDNLYVLQVAVNFREQGEVEKLMRSIDKAGEGWTCVFVDTVARSLVGADENSATELGLWVAAADSLKAHCKCALVGIHHSGKDSTRGMRGSSALLGAVDTSLVVSKDENIVYMRCEKQKDAEPIDEQVFEMTEVALIDGASVVLTRVDGDKPVQKKKAKGLTVNQQLALEALRNVVIDTGNQVVSASLWHEAHKQKCPDLARQRAGEARHALIEAGLVAADKNKVWLVNENN
jgi:hypothetical protein